MQKYIKILNSKRIVVIGVGNLLMGDDGVGVHVADVLSKEDLPPHVQVFDGATRAFDVLDYMDGADKAVIVDAYKNDGAPGSIYRFRFDPAHNPEWSPNLSMHDIDFVEALRVGRGIYELPEEIVIIGIEPCRLDWSLELSPEVRNAIPAVVDAIKSEFT